MKKSVCLILAALVCLLTNSFTAFAMPQEAQTIPVKIKNFPYECEYIDLLIDIDEEHEYYTKANTENMQAQPFDTTELAEYNKDGFVSYTCHFKGAKSDLRIKGGWVCVVKNDLAPKIINLKLSVMVAVLNRNGHILKVSDAVTISDDKCFMYDGSCIEYDYTSGKASANVYVDPDYSGLFKAFLVIISVVFIMVFYLAAHSFASSLKKPKDNQVSNARDDETPGGYLKAVAVFTVLFIIAALIQGFAFSKLYYHHYLHPSTLTAIPLCIAQLLPLILAVVTAVRAKDLLKFVVPDFAFGFVSAQFAGKNTLILLMIFIFVVVQVLSMSIAVFVESVLRKRKRSNT